MLSFSSDFPDFHLFPAPRCPHCPIPHHSPNQPPPPAQVDQMAQYQSPQSEHWTEQTQALGRQPRQRNSIK